MLYLIQLEWMKWRRSTAFWLACLIYLSLLPLLLVSIHSMQIDLPGASPDAMVQFPYVWSFTAYAGNWLVFFCGGFLAIYTLTSEFNYHTFRQNILTGLSRKELWLAKVGWLLTLSLLASAYYCVIALIIGGLNTSTVSLEAVLARIDMLPRFFLMCLGYLALGFLLALWIRRTAITVFIYFAYVLLLEPFIRWTVHRRMFQNLSMHFYPANVFEDLAPLPLDDLPMTRDFIQQNEFAFFLSPGEAVIASSIYLLIIFFISWRLITKQDF